MFKFFFIIYLSLFGFTQELADITANECRIKTNGTIKNLKEIFLGRCYYFLNIRQRKNCDINPKNYNCTKIWLAFEAASTGRTPCNITINDYSNFLSLVNHSIPANSTFFYSGTYGPAQDFVRMKPGYFSLEDTFSGYLLNELTFCSTNKSEKNFSHESCPQDCVTRDSPFWNAASIDFAKKASGTVYVMLNGTRNYGALSKASTFFKHELPYLHSDKIKKLTVLLLHSPGQTKYETCDKPKTLNTLSNILLERNITYICEDDLKDMAFLLCFYDQAESSECQKMKSSEKTKKQYQN